MVYAYKNYVAMRYFLRRGHVAPTKGWVNIEYVSLNHLKDEKVRDWTINVKSTGHKLEIRSLRFNNLGHDK